MNLIIWANCLLDNGGILILRMSNELQTDGSAAHENITAPVSPNLVFDVLASPHRQVILALLSNRMRPIREHDLATEVAAWEQDVLLLEVAEEERHRIRSALYHSHLPKLEDAGLIEWDTDRNTVAPTDHPTFQKPEIETIIREQREEPRQTWDALFSVLSTRRHQAILSVLDEQYESLTVAELAERIAAHENDTSEEAVADAEVEQVSMDLIHAKLPKLDDIGLVDYDTDRNTVTFQGDPALDEEWLELNTLDEGMAA